MLLRDSIQKLIHKQNLDASLCQAVMQELLDEETNQLQIAAFLVLLRAKPETTEELVAIVNSLRQKMISVPTHHRVLDIVGTGGDHANTVNISTGSAILAASCGVKVAKHGNRAVSSLTGTADVLEALGLKIELSPEKVSYCIDEVGIGFCYFPLFHPHIQQLRSLGKQLKVPTALNYIGTLLNPAHAAHYLTGVFDEALLTTFANVLMHTGTKRSLVVHGSGLDEISCVAPTKAIEVTSTSIKPMLIDPADYQLPYCKLEELRGSTAKVNANLLLHCFKGERGAISNTLILNAATALYLYGLYPSIALAIPHVSENLYNGNALKLLQRWIECSHDT